MNYNHISTWKEGVEQPVISTIIARWLPKAFTLVELLVVLAIISILAALLMPSLKNARISAYNVRDIANVRQLALAAHLYTQDHDDYLPGSLITNGVAISDGGGWVRQLAPYVGITTNFANGQTYGIPLNGKSVFYCDFKVTGSGPANYDGRYMYAMNFMLRYAGNAYHYLAGTSVRNVRMAEILDRDRTMIFTESGWTWDTTSPADLDNAFFGAGAAWGVAHGGTGKIPFSYLDGHADFWAKSPTFPGNTSISLPWTHNRFWGEMNGDTFFRGSWEP